MKKLFAYLIVLLLAGNAVALDSRMTSPQNDNEKKLTAMFGYSIFYQTDQKTPYIETYLSFEAQTVNFVKIKEGQYQAVIEVTIIGRQGDSVAFVKKYDLKSPIVSDEKADKFQFMDLQRIAANNGIYNVEVTLRDKNAPSDPVSVTEKVVVFFDKNKPSMSSIQTMVNAEPTKQQNIFSRAGYDMEPYIDNYYPANIGSINFYYEIYNIMFEVGSKDFKTYCYIEESSTGRHSGNVHYEGSHKSNKIVPLYTSMDITQLPSGKYNLVCEVRNHKNQLLMYKKYPFFRSNPKVSLADSVTNATNTFAADITNEEQLNYYLDALYPIASPDEESMIASLRKENNIETKQIFFYKFWQDRDAMDPANAWFKYRTRLEYVDKNFSYPRTPGYRTDRGRVYLQYGPPDYIRDEKNFVSALRLGSGNNQTLTASHALSSQGHIYYLPYQLWRYNKLETDDANRVFLFWDEFRSNYYKLLVSNARGEVWDPLWERRLSQQQLGEDVIGEVGEQFQRGY